MNFYGTNKYNEMINDKTSRIFSKCNLLSPTESIKLNDIYSLKYYFYKDNEDISHEYARDLRGAICRLYKNDKNIFEWKHLYDKPRISKIIEHANGNSYFIFDEDLYGYSVLDLTTLECMHYIPAESYDKENFVDTFIWRDVYYNKINNYLAVEGCVWADVYSIIIIDFTNPMIAVEANKWKFIKDDSYDIAFKEWNGNELEYLIEDNGETKKIDITEMKDEKDKQ